MEAQLVRALIFSKRFLQRGVVVPRTREARFALENLSRSASAREEFVRCSVLHESRVFREAMRTVRVRTKIQASRSYASEERAKNGKKKLSRKISGDDFRHPLDQQNTALLRALPGFSTFARAAVGSVTEQAMLLENVGSCVRVGEKQLPRIHEVHAEAASVLGLDPAPELYVRQDPQPNAYTLAVSGHAPFVVVHTALVELLDMDELQAVLAHEMGHLKCDHGLWLSMALAMADGATRMPGLGGLLATPIQDGLLRWLRAAELTCDRAALLVVQDSRVVISALMKLAGGSPSIAKDLNVDAFLEQARSYDEATRSPMGWYLRNAQTRQLSHPLPVLRAREIDRWSTSAEYKALVEVQG